MPDIFNDYDDSGYRMNVAGCRSSKTEDQSILTNLRGSRFKDLLANCSDQMVVNMYDWWAFDPRFGNNDEFFADFVSEYLED